MTRHLRRVLIGRCRHGPHEPVRPNRSTGRRAIPLNPVQIRQHRHRPGQIPRCITRRSRLIHTAQRRPEFWLVGKGVPLMTDYGRSLPGDGWMFAGRTVEEIAGGVGWWLSSRSSSPGTWSTYCADLGVPYLLAAHERGGAVADAVRREYGVTVPVYEPTKRNTTWH